MSPFLPWACEARRVDSFGREGLLNRRPSARNHRAWQPNQERCKQGLQACQHTDRPSDQTCKRELVRTKTRNFQRICTQSQKR